MKLLTKEIERTIPALYSTEDTPAEEKRAVVKFFTPDSNWTWYVSEGSKDHNGNWTFFGLVEGFEREWGYFTLAELAAAKGPLGLPIERDLHFDGVIPS
jgi:hypothetical protein